MSYPVEIDQGERTARKPHQCFDCYRTIPAGERHYYFTGKDGGIYTIRSHLDCHAAADEYIKRGYPSDYWDGVPPLADMISDGGEFELDCNSLRGTFPHVVTRLELGEQLSDVRRADRLRAEGIEPDPEDCQPVYG